MRVAKSSAELRAAASLRAAAFSEESTTRSDLTLQVLCKHLISFCVAPMLSVDSCDQVSGAAVSPAYEG